MTCDLLTTTGRPLVASARAASWNLGLGLGQSSSTVGYPLESYDGHPPMPLRGGRNRCCGDIIIPIIVTRPRQPFRGGISGVIPSASVPFFRNLKRNQTSTINNRHSSIFGISRLLRRRRKTTSTCRCRYGLMIVESRLLIVEVK
jgi:hypothetical protein